MGGHEAKWEQQPDKSGSVGQYYCARCKLTLQVWYNENRVVERCTGWYWQIEDGSGAIIDSAGNKYAPKYEVDSEALDEVRQEGVLRFESVPCRRAN